MTRINVGIRPAELCDQHLLAEIRELPRVIGVEIKTPPPPAFKLGAGHVAWCAQYQGSLAGRLWCLVAEARRRGFNVHAQTKREPCNGRCWSIGDAAFARPIVQERIRERLASMVREPKWTKRKGVI